MLNEEYVEVYILLSKCYFKIGKHKEFIEYLSKAMNSVLYIYNYLDAEIKRYILEWRNYYKDDYLTYFEWSIFDYFEYLEEDL
ncbi:MAG: hypothetical protein K9G38_05235 [Bacteroidales bacterium]|nr:hypothetical protein [Bacteroidales bacterium]